MFILVTIIVSLILVTVFFVVLTASLMSANVTHHARKIQIDHARIEVIHGENQRRATLHETRLARENNATVLQDIQIEKEQVKLEIERLKLAAIQKELAPPPFDAATDYDSDRDPFEPLPPPTEESH